MTYTFDIFIYITLTFILRRILDIISGDFSIKEIDARNKPEKIRSWKMKNSY